MRKSLTAAGFAAVLAVSTVGGAQGASAASCGTSLDPAPYVSVGTHVEQYYNVCSQTSNWRVKVSLQRKGTPNKAVAEKTHPGVVNTRAKLSANVNGDGTKQYRGLISVTNTFNGSTASPITNNWKSLTT